MSWNPKSIPTNLKNVFITNRFRYLCQSQMVMFSMCCSWFMRHAARLNFVDLPSWCLLGRFKWCLVGRMSLCKRHKRCVYLLVSPPISIFGGWFNIGIIFSNQLTPICHTTGLFFPFLEDDPGEPQAFFCFFFPLCKVESTPNIKKLIGVWSRLMKAGEW